MTGRGFEQVLIQNMNMRSSRGAVVGSRGRWTTPAEGAARCAQLAQQCRRFAGLRRHAKYVAVGAQDRETATPFFEPFRQIVGGSNELGTELRGHFVDSNDSNDGNI